MTRAFDVAVVGASPAGLRAAWAAAEAGAETVLLEARPSLSEPAGPATVAFDHLWSAEVRPAAGAVRARRSGIRVRSPSNHVLDVDAPLSVLDRARFDRDLARAAEDAGASLRFGLGDLTVDADRTLRAEGYEARPGIILFADGARTLARRFFEPVRHPAALTWGVALEFPCDAALARPVITLGSHAPGGRSQFDVVGGRATHWTFARGDAEEARRLARPALARDLALSGLSSDVGLDARETAVAPDPVFTLPRRLVADGILVAGGAAGQGGLEAGLAAGELAGRVAGDAARAGRRDAAALARYERAWKRDHLAGYRLLALAARPLATLDDPACDRLLAPWHGRSIGVDDLEGLAAASAWRRARAALALALRNPRALPPLAAAALA